MKYLLLLFLSFSAFAQYAKEANLFTGSLEVYRSKELCGSGCIKIPVGFNRNIHSLVNEQVDDLTKPVYSKNEIEACLDAPDCQTKLEAKTCLDTHENAIKNLDLLEVYCSKFLHYEKKYSGQKIVVVDEVKKSSYESSKAIEDQKEAAIQLALKAQNCGKRVQALLAVRNVSKALTKAQKKQIVSTYSSIKNLLDSGSLEVARDDILAVVADGVLVTESDKTELVAELDKCK